MAYISEPFDPPQAPVLPKRILPDKIRYSSIDALKGLAILSLWLVNAAPLGPETPPALKPGPWGHPSFADCIFPALLIGIGAGIPLSAAFRVGRDEIGRFLMGSLSKAFWLIVFGIFMDSAVAHHLVFQVGALQLLGVAYFVNALFAKTPIILRAFLAEALLLGFYAWCKLTAVPGSFTGTFNEKINIIHHFDEKVLALNGLQGLFALIAITSIVMTGSVFGSLYLHEENRFKRGLIIMGCGGTMTFFGWLWSLDMPMSAALWTSSYALFVSGIATMVLGAFSIFFDFENGKKIAYLLRMPASCIILAIVGPVLLKTLVLDAWTMPGTTEPITKGLERLALAPTAPPINAWIYTIGVVLLWWIILAIAYHRREFLRNKTT